MIIAASLLVLAWIATYALHSALWLIPGIWFARRAPVAPRIRSTVLLVCVVAPLFTTSLGRFAQLGAPLPFPGLRVEEDRRVARTIDPLGQVETTESGGLTLPSRILLLSIAGLAGAFLVVSAVQSATMMRARQRAVRDFGTRTLVTSQGWLSVFGELTRELSLSSPPRLSCAESLASPVALNWEICIPRSWSERNDADEMRVVLAHELGHVVWRDPQLLAALQFLRRALPWQPLLALAAASYLEAAEEACDAAAIRSTGDARSVAHVLLRLAPVRPAAVAFTNLNSGRGIRQRIERIVAAPSTMRSGPAVGGALIAGLLIVSMLLPHVATPNAEVSPDVDMRIEVINERR